MTCQVCTRFFEILTLTDGRERSGPDLERHAGQMAAAGSGAKAVEALSAEKAADGAPAEGPPSEEKPADDAKAAEAPNAEKPAEKPAEKIAVHLTWGR